MRYIVIVAAQNCNKRDNIQVNQITMGRRYKKRINYKRLKEKKRSKQENVEIKRLEKLERANNRRKLKVRLELRLKKLTRARNLKYQYLSE